MDTIDRWQAQYNFWSGFGMPAYQENSVPDAKELSFPYLTYEAVDALPGSDRVVSASIWTRSTSWEQADTLAEVVYNALKDGGQLAHHDGGMIWFTAADTLAQSMGDPDDDAVKRKFLNVTAHFC